jgi:hypothetical protein
VPYSIPPTTSPLPPHLGQQLQVLLERDVGDDAALEGAVGAVGVIGAVRGRTTIALVSAEPKKQPEFLCYSVLRAGPVATLEAPGFRGPRRGRRTHIAGAG